MSEQHESPPAVEETSIEAGDDATQRMRAQIRGIGLRDLDGVQTLYEKLNAELSKTDPITALGENQAFVAWSFKQLRQQLLAEQNYHGAVAVSEDGEVLGYCTGAVKISGALFAVQQYGTITEFYVDEPYRGNGLGKQLLAYVVAKFGELGLRHVEISGPPGISAEGSFLSRLGFEPASTRMVLNARLEGSEQDADQDADG